MRRVPEKGHTYGRHTRAAEELKRKADKESKDALAEIEAKIRSGRCTEADKHEYVDKLLAIQSEFYDSLTALYRSNNPG